MVLCRRPCSWSDRETLAEFVEAFEGEVRYLHGEVVRCRREVVVQVPRDDLDDFLACLAREIRLCLFERVEGAVKKYRRGE
jgi:hypothetical protein